MESALYGIYALVVVVSEILLVRCAHSFDFGYVNNSCVNTVRTPALSIKASEGKLMIFPVVKDVLQARSTFTAL